jgi:hypothetical protein
MKIQYDNYSIFFFIGTTAPVGPGLPPWNCPFHFGFFLNHIQSVGRLGRVISSSQGLYLFTNTEKHTYTNTKHSCPEWDSKPRSRLPSERRECTLPLGYRDRHYSVWTKLWIMRGQYPSIVLLMLSSNSGYTRLRVAFIPLPNLHLLSHIYSN